MKKANAWFIGLILTLILAASPAFGANVFVRDGSTCVTSCGANWTSAYPTVQQGISAATSNDVVCVFKGEYSYYDDENSMITMKAYVDVIGGFSTNDDTGCDMADDRPGGETGHVPTLSVLNGEYQVGATVYNVDHVVVGNQFSEINGFLIKNGKADTTGYEDGGGLYVNLSVGQSFTVKNCIFQDNEANGSGGGMYVGSYTNVTIQRVIFLRNKAYEETDGQGGGGLFVYYGKADIDDCSFIKNYAVDSGGGAGLRLTYDTSTLDNVSFLGNESDWVAGGLHLLHGETVYVTNAEFRGNISAEWGGGMSVDGSGAEVYNALFMNNYSGAYAGGVESWGWDADLTLSYCTFMGNEAASQGGAVDTGLDSVTTIEKSIIWDNVAPTGPSVYQCTDGSGCSVTLNYTDIEGGWAGSGGNNLDAHPRFDLTSELGRVYLSNASDSPCIDASSETAAAAGLDSRTTRKDHTTDSGTADLGYHYYAN